MALCPNCSAEVVPTAEKCPTCGAQFSGGGWKPVEPQTPKPPVPLTRADKQQGVIIVVAFIIWLPVYLMVVRPLINSYLAARGVTGYPALLHLFPIFLAPVIIGVIAKTMSKKEAKVDL
jgi:hypothetical protein